MEKKRRLGGETDNEAKTTRGDKWGRERIEKRISKRRIRVVLHESVLRTYLPVTLTFTEAENE